MWNLTMIFDFNLYVNLLLGQDARVSFAWLWLIYLCFSFPISPLPTSRDSHLIEGRWRLFPSMLSRIAQIAIWAIHFFLAKVCGWLMSASSSLEPIHTWCSSSSRVHLRVGILSRSVIVNASLSLVFCASSMESYLT